MSISDDKWFEVWFIQGVDVTPACLYIVTPDTDQRGRILVIDLYGKNEVVFNGKDYEETMLWLQEDEFSLIDGRVFPDDGWSFQPGKAV